MEEKLTFQEFADKSKELLSKNDEWKDRYRGYANMIDPEQRTEPEAFQKFRVKAPLYCYTTIGNETQNKPITFLRYMGQNVATISASEVKVTVHISSALVASIKQFEGGEEFITTLCGFDVDSELCVFDWVSEDGAKFREFFATRPERRKKNKEDNKKENKEHALESLLLTELEKKLAQGKSLHYIQPVELSGKRLQLPTPLKASAAKNDILEYATSNGGGIDILARRKVANASYLTVIELKDENNSGERPEDAIKQATAYAVFVRELLRCEAAGNAIWYRLFGMNGAIPTSLKILCVIAMPDIKNVDMFKGIQIKLDEDILELHCMSINKETGVVDKSSL